MSESSEKGRRDFLRKGALGVTLAACGSLVFSSCNTSAGEDSLPPEPGDTVKVLTPQGELVEVGRSYLQHTHHVHEVSYEEARKGIEGRKFVMVIDLARCNNARKCITACQKMHHLPPDKEWLTVKLMKDCEEGAPYWFPKTCFHCDNPPCVKVCPVDATFKRQDGLVLIDNDRCIGCKFCMTACPYSTRVFNWGEQGQPADMSTHHGSAETSMPPQVGTVEKCDFCPDMARMGKLPDCVTACPNGAFYFGDENEDIVTNGAETVRFSQLIKDRAGYRYGEELGTKPRVYYLPPSNRMFPVGRGLEEVPEELMEQYEGLLDDSQI